MKMNEESFELLYIKRNLINDVIIYYLELVLEEQTQIAMLSIQRLKTVCRFARDEKIFFVSK